MTAKGLTEKVDARLQKKEADKKFYIGMSYELVNNPEFNSQLFYPVETVEPVVRWQFLFIFFHKQTYSNKNKSIIQKYRYYMPQLNHISMHMPSAPLLYQTDDIHDVKITSL